MPKDLNQVIKILFYCELKEITNFKTKLLFLDDLIILHGQNNLTELELELKFIERKIPNFPQEIFIEDSSLKDLIIRAAIDQRKIQTLKIDNIFRRSGNKNMKGKVNLNLLKSINIKKR